MKEVKAIFKGQNESMGYLTNHEYVLQIEEGERKSIRIHTRAGNGECQYSSILTFLQNWDCIRNISE